MTTANEHARLLDLGLSPAIEQTFRERARAGSVLGRVVRLERGYAHAVTDAGERTVAVPKGLAQDPETAPVTGDWAELDLARGALVAIVPRRTAIVRRAAGRRTSAQVVAANVDVVFVLMGLDGDFNPRRVERYLALAQESGAEVVVLLTKAGKVDDVASRVASVSAVAPGVAVRAIDVVDGIDVEAPRRWLTRGATVVLLGSSGVGKSTLVNHLMGADVALTKAVRAHDDRGKHTTTRRELFELPGGGVVIDTPGMRELSLWADDDALATAFADVVALAEGCRFRDCRHQREPGCAVREAVEAGTLPEARLASFANLRDELERNVRDRRARERRSTGRSTPPGRPRR